jgi:flagellar biosynthetic protein FlhB
VLPNCLAPLIVQAALGVSDAILEAAALGFLGLGAQPPTAEWGTMLARALYAHAELDREIPAALFAAVAQVLAYVYQLRAALRGQVPMPGEVPVVDVPVELDPHFA